MSNTTFINNLPDWKIVYKYRDRLPASKKIWKEYLNSKIKEIKNQLNKFTPLKRQLSNIVAKAPLKDQWFFEIVADVMFLEDFPLLQRDLKSLTFKLAALESKENITQEYPEAQIEQAKSIPLKSIFPNLLRSMGGRLVGRCPFHKDKTPSFTIYPDQNSFYCYSCLRGGDIIKYVEIKEECSFREAIKFLINS